MAYRILNQKPRIEKAYSIEQKQMPQEEHKLNEINGWKKQSDINRRVRISNFWYNTTVPSWKKGKKFIQVVRKENRGGLATDWYVQIGVLRKTKYGEEENIVREIPNWNKNEAIKTAKDIMKKK